MENKIERLWFLMGILIGFYGNWYFNLLLKIEQITHNMTMLNVLALISAISLFVYCIEIAHWRKTLIKGMFHLSVILAILHLLSTSLIFYIIETPPITFVSTTGLILWCLITSYEIRLHWPLTLYLKN